jgi:hypothetical protein
MQALKVMGTLDAQGQLILDQPLPLEQQCRVEVIVLIPEATEDPSPTKIEQLNDFREAWHEAMTGQTIAVEELWSGLENA